MTYKKFLPLILLLCVAPAISLGAIPAHQTSVKPSSTSTQKPKPSTGLQPLISPSTINVTTPSPSESPSANSSLPTLEATSTWLNKNLSSPNHYLYFIKDYSFSNPIENGYARTSYTIEPKNDIQHSYFKTSDCNATWSWQYYSHVQTNWGSGSNYVDIESDRFALENIKSVIFYETSSNGGFIRIQFVTPVQFKISSGLIGYGLQYLKRTELDLLTLGNPNASKVPKALLHASNLCKQKNDLF